MNTFWWFLLIAVNFGGIIIVYRIFGRQGLLVWVPISAIVANIQVIKLIEVFGFEATLGNIVYATSFLATDILSENHGKKDARLGVLMAMVFLALVTLIMFIAVRFTPSEADTAHRHLAAVFELMPRIAGASFAAFALSQLHDVWAYHFWKQKKPGKRFIWIRNNASTLVSQAIDSAIFTVGAFAGVLPPAVLVEIIFTTYLFKIVVAALDTPLVYLAAGFAKK